MEEIPHFYTPVRNYLLQKYGANQREWNAYHAPMCITPARRLMETEAKQKNTFRRKGVKSQCRDNACGRGGGAEAAENGICKCIHENWVVLGTARWRQMRRADMQLPLIREAEVFALLCPRASDPSAISKRCTRGVSTPPAAIVVLCILHYVCRAGGPGGEAYI